MEKSKKLYLQGISDAEYNMLTDILERLYQNIK
jgi:hypothetical protein